jgi:hypothetical protein
MVRLPLSNGAAERSLVRWMMNRLHSKHREPSSTKQVSPPLLAPSAHSTPPAPSGTSMSSVTMMGLFPSAGAQNSGIRVIGPAKSHSV